ncbi:AAA family ATPase [Spirosoma aerophilum]
MFKLLSLEFRDHPYLGDLNVVFTPIEEKEAVNYTTLIIGPNGTGKSQVLLAIIQIFNWLAEQRLKGDKTTYQRKKLKFKYGFKLHYFCQQHEYTIEYKINSGISLSSKVGASLWVRYENDTSYLPLPTELLISSFTFNDKYPLSDIRTSTRREIDEIDLVPYEQIHKPYQYLGLKSTTNSIFIGNPQRATIEYLIEAVRAKKSLFRLVDVLKRLDIEPEIRFIYKPSRNYSLLFNKNSLENEADSIWKLIERLSQQANKNSNRIASTKYEKTLHNEEVINILDRYLFSNNSRISNYDKNDELAFSIRFDNENTYAKFIEEAVPLQYLQNLEIFTFDRFELTKNKKLFPFENASSGEYHLLFMFINILSFIEPDSLVLIDEPEISLHPNWQLQFMSLMKAAFIDFPTTQFIICSHSHFLVSDLQPETSNIVSLNFDRTTKRITSKSIEKNTFAWSAEQILLDVFEMPTTRNFYLSIKITEILELMAIPEPDRNLIDHKLNELRDYDFSNLNDADPFKKVINKLLSIG